MTCQQCGVVFKLQQAKVRKGWGKFCTWTCYWASRGTLEERLRSGSDTTGECWVWLGHHDKDGYGVLRDNGQTDKAHRIAYRLFKGLIPSGLFVCHTCDNPPCWRPEHLWLGTAADNQRDMARKGRGTLKIRASVAK